MRSPDHATLSAIVALACRAPSVHNTQPWRWVGRGDRLELHADTHRHLQYADQTGRDLVVSCGAALHHATVAAAAAGWATTVDRLPDAGNPDHLATLRLRPRAPSEEDHRLAALIGHRSTDRRQVTSWPVPTSRIAGLVMIAHDHGVLATGGLDGDAKQVVLDALPVATQMQNRNDAYLDELLAWSHTRDATGVPTTNLLTRSADAWGPGSLTRFPTGSLEDEYSEGVEPEATWVVLSTSSDDRLSWLRSGEALSAIWLTCTGAGLSLVPYSQVIEVDDTRALIQREVLGGTSCPQAVLRIGWPPMDRRPVPSTPRRPVESVLELREEPVRRPSW